MIESEIRAVFIINIQTKLIVNCIESVHVIIVLIFASTDFLIQCRCSMYSLAVLLDTSQQGFIKVSPEAYM